jgi:hypothetical protein
MATGYQYIPREGPVYAVTYTSVDGAGRYPEVYTDPRDAIAAADALRQDYTSYTIEGQEYLAR